MKWMMRKFGNWDSVTLRGMETRAQEGYRMFYKVMFGASHFCQDKDQLF